MTTTTTARTSWYDYPQYYDIAFRSETQQEADFIEAACRKHCPFTVRRLLEPACGTGRLIAELAARGYRMMGLDLSEPALRYFRQRLVRRDLRAAIFRADMADFKMPVPVDAAYCTMSSFRHLLTEEAARRHLECIARSLRPGGIYILGIHLVPLNPSEECARRWTARHGRTQVTTTLRVLATNPSRRIERLRVNLLVRSGRQELRLHNEYALRLYTAVQFRKLLATVPCLELRDVYDFDYEINRPLELNGETSDAVFILKKRSDSR
jgi:SAM-dependent methyltransferase